MKNQNGMSDNEINNHHMKTFETVVMPIVKKNSAEEIRVNWMRRDSSSKAKLSLTFRQSGRRGDLFNALVTDFQDNKKLQSKGDKQHETTTLQVGIENYGTYITPATKLIVRSLIKESKLYFIGNIAAAKYTVDASGNAVDERRVGFCL